MRSTTVLAAAAAVLVLAGCTSSDGRQDGGPTPTPTPGAAAGSGEPTGGETADGPAPQELSAQVIEAASVPAGAPLASQTVVLTEDTGPRKPGVEVRVDVLGLRRTPDATLLTFQLTSPQPGVLLGPQALSTGASYNTEFWTRFALEDTAAGTRYLPLSWRRPDEKEVGTAVQAGPPNSCVCPYRGGTRLSPVPFVFDVMYGPLPADVGTVRLTAPDGVLLPGLPVEPAGR